VNLEDRLSAAARAITAPTDMLDVRRRLREVEQEYERRSGAPEALRDLVVDIERHAALERAYRTGAEAWRRGDVRTAIAQLTVAADQHIGDASLLLAQALTTLGDYQDALRWCRVAAVDGLVGAEDLARRCQQLVHGREPTRSQPTPVPATPPPAADEDEAAKRRRFLAHAAAVTCGTAVLGGEDEWVVDGGTTKWDWRGVGVQDVRQLEAATRALRSLDHQYGGVSCRDAVIGQLAWGEPMLGGTYTAAVGRRLRTAVADLNSLAGWVSFDVGLVDSARSYFARALDLLRDTGAYELTTYVLCRAGRMYLHAGEPHEALKYFQLGQVSALRTDNSRVVALLVGCAAWANGVLAREDEALRLLAATRRELDRAPGRDVVTPPDEAVLATVGSTYAALARRINARYAGDAITALTHALRAFEVDRARSRTFIFTSLAGSHLVAENANAAQQMGSLALVTADKVHSERVDDEFVLLKQDADRHGHPAARQLADRITERLVRHAC
jgi:tetratricopeptide (TPR) repeat protein